jgi:AraC-like DNA-binding protein
MREIQVHQHDDGADRWTMIHAAPEPKLRPFVRSYCSYSERTASFQTRSELATTSGVLILNLGAPIQVVGAGGEELSVGEGEFFVAGASAGTSSVRTCGAQRGLEVELPTSTLARLLGAPMAELCNRAVPLESVLDGGRTAAAELRRLAGKIDESRSSEQSFAALDQYLEHQLDQRPPAEPELEWARRQLCRVNPPPVDQLARYLGWSRRRFTNRFRGSRGVTPSTFRRLARFERFWRALRALPASDLAGLAVECGYFDQPHLHRDVRDFAEQTPAQLRRALLPDGGGFVADGTC